MDKDLEGSTQLFSEIGVLLKASMEMPWTGRSVRTGMIPFVPIASDVQPPSD